MEKRVNGLDYIVSRLADPKYISIYGPGEVEALTAEIDEARGRYKSLLGSA